MLKCILFADFLYFIADCIYTTLFTTNDSRSKNNKIKQTVWLLDSDWRNRRTGGDVLSVVCHEKNMTSKNYCSSWWTRTTSASTQRQQQPHTVLLPLCPADDPVERGAATILDVSDDDIDVDNDNNDEMEDEVFDRCESWLLDVARANESKLRRS